MTPRQRARYLAKKRRDELIARLHEAEGRGDTNRIEDLRSAVSQADREARRTK